MIRIQSRRYVTGVMAMLVAGCTIAELNREEKGDEARVRQRENDLQYEQARNNSLNQQKDELAADLSRRQLSLADLNDRLQRIRTANALAAESNDAVRAEHVRQMTQIREASAEISALQQNTTDSSEEKQRKIEYLKRQINLQLNLLLH